MKIYRITLVILFSLCDIPAVSEPASAYIYNDYRDSLITLQQDVAQIYLELQQKNSQAVYQQALQAIEKTAALIGHAEIASHHMHSGFQGSLKGQMELLLEFGLSEKQKKDLLDLGYTEKDIADTMKSLAYYNDHYYRAAAGFSPEQREQFSLMGLTDAQMSQLQVAVTNHYTQIHTLEEEIKHHQRELLYVQFSLSIAALKILDQEDKGKKSDNLKRGEEKLLGSIKNISKDQSSLERVKAFSKQVFKAAEQKIRNGESQYMVDFFVGLQIHCGAVTALHGDVTFGLVEIKSYEGVLSQCISPERLVLFACNESLDSPELDFAESDFAGNIEESNEGNNTGWIVAVV